MRHSDSGTTGRDRQPMTFLEWERSIDTLADSPERAARLIEGMPAERLTAVSGPGRWSAAEVVCHLRDSDRDVLVPRLARFLAEVEPHFEGVDLTALERIRTYAGVDAGIALTEWQTRRAEAVVTLQTLGRRDWERLGFHPERGPYTLGDLVRAFVEHDVSHLHQLAGALRASA